MRLPLESYPCCTHDRATADDTLTRRRLLGVAAGAASAAVLSRFWLPTLAHAAPMGGPKPIPGGVTVPFAKGLFHVFLPEPGKEPSTITDFDGIVGLSVVRGACTRTRAGGAAPERFIYETDMRFMTGRYVGADGKTATGTFGFVWLDVFEGQVDPSRQLHDINPGITSDGLFWTVPLPRGSVQVNLSAGTATMRMAPTPMPDQQNLINALNNGPSIPANVAFTVRWRGAGKRRQLRNTQERFVAQTVENRSTIEWQLETGPFRIVSDPAQTSRNVYSLLARERNGVFFR